MILLKCIKSLRNRNRQNFVKDKEYEYYSIENDFIWIVDERYEVSAFLISNSEIGAHPKLHKLSDYFSAESIDNLNKLLLLL